MKDVVEDINKLCQIGYFDEVLGKILDFKAHILI